MKNLYLLTALLGLALAGCGKDAPPAGGEGAANAPGSNTPGAPAPVVKALEAPPELLVYGGTNNTADTVEQLRALAAQVVPEVPPLPAMLAPALQNEFRLKDAATLDTKRPLRFAIFDQKTYGRAPEALMVAINNEEAFAAALPDNEKAKDVDGNAWSYLKFPGSKQPVYVNFASNYAVITRNKDLFVKNKAFFEALGGATMPDAGGAIVELENVVRLYGPEIDKAFKKMGEVMAMAAEASPQAKGQVEMMQGLIASLSGATREAHQLRVSLVVKDGLQLDVRLVPKAGSGLAGQLAQLTGTGKSDLLARLPVDAPFFFAAAMDSDKVADLATKMTEAFMTRPIFKGDAARAKPYQDATSDYMKAMDGQVVISAFPSPAGLQLLGLFGIRDLPKLKAAQNKLMGIYQEPDAMAYYETLGVGMEMQKAAYTVGDVSVDIQRTTLKNMPPEAMVMMGAMGDLFVQHIALSSTLGILAYGETGKTSVEALLGGTFKGGLDQAQGPKRAVAGAAAGFFALLYVNPIELAKAIKLGGMNPLAAMLAEVKAETGVSISFAIQDGSLRTLFDVPLDTVKQGFAAFEKTKGSF